MRILLGIVPTPEEDNSRKRQRTAPNSDTPPEPAPKLQAVSATSEVKITPELHSANV